MWFPAQSDIIESRMRPKKRTSCSSCSWIKHFIKALICPGNCSMQVYCQILQMTKEMNISSQAVGPSATGCATWPADSMKISRIGGEKGKGTSRLGTHLHTRPLELFPWDNDFNRRGHWDKCKIEQDFDEGVHRALMVGIVLGETEVLCNKYQPSSRIRRQTNVAKVIWFILKVSLSKSTNESGTLDSTRLAFQVRAVKIEYSQLWFLY